jgi:oligopeptide/dipeptide ABC transporter ATP-binding protein
VSEAASVAAERGDADGNGAQLLEVEHLQILFPIRKGLLIDRTVAHVHAVNDVSFELREGETLGIVGESGCGKTTLARGLMRLLEPGDGVLRFRGDDITHVSRKDLQPIRRHIQMVFQDPYASLNPRKRVGQIVSAPLKIQGIDAEAGERVRKMLERVGLNPEHVNRFPHEFSGGQRQRIGVARALALRPKAIIADEPVSALDVSIQAQILNLLRDLQREFDLTLVFIAHDLSVVRHMCDRIAVMYLGKIVELASGDQLYAHPRHPYTGALLSAVPVADPRLAANKKRQILAGDVPSPTNPPPACRFHTRCPKAVAGHCDTEEPMLDPKDGGNLAACHYPLTDQEIAERVPTARVVSR